jgi:hypothetical protein
MGHPAPGKAKSRYGISRVDDKQLRVSIAENDKPSGKV